MRKLSKYAVSLALGVCLIFSGCGTKPTGGKGSNGKELTDLVTWETQNREIESFNMLYSQAAADSNVLCNCVDGLLTADTKGKLVPAIATSWKTEDGGKTWTFKLRDDVTWVDYQGNEKAKLTSQDFVTGLEWVLNFHKNDSANTSMPVELIQGASEYYEYTKGLDPEEALKLDTSKMLEMVGISAPDDTTVTYTCVSEKPYFDSVATYNCLYPVSKAMIDELGVEGYKSVDYQKMWYNGPYTITNYVQGNQKVLTKNEKYYNKDCKRFNTVTIKMVESLDVAFQQYQTGELNTVDLTEANLKTIYDSTSNPYHDQLVEKRPTKFSYQMHLNYEKHLDDGSLDTNWNTAVANKAFRLSWLYGLELTPWYARTNAINPLKCENNTYTMSGLVYLSDGTEYTKLIKDNLGIGEYNGKTMLRYNKEKGEQYKKQAMEELSKQGVTFPVQIDYYVIGSSQTAIDSATVLKQCFKDSLGDDYVQLNIKTYISSLTKEVVKPKLQSFAVNGWGADYADPQNYLGQETYGEDNAYYSQTYSNINNATDADLIASYKEYTQMVNDANAINDNLDERYKAYAKAETYMIENAFTIPVYYEIGWELTHINDYSKPNAMFGIQNYRYVDLETSVDAYTTEQYKKFADEAAK